MTRGSDVLVVGGGAVGASCARALALAGARVTVIRRPELPGQAWRAAAGMLAAQIEAGPEEPLFNLGVAGRAFYRNLAGPLRESTGIDIGLSQGGILQVATSEDQVAAFKAKVAWQRQQAEQADFLEPADVEEGWPWLRPGHGAFWAAEDGLLSPEKLVDALLTDAARLGARVLDDRVTALWREDGRMKGVIGTAQRYPAAVVVIAAGAWSGRLEELPRPLSVEPVRGQLLAFEWPADADAGTVYGDHCYLLRRGEEMIVGSTMEHAGFDAGTTPEATAALTARVTAIYPPIAVLSPKRHWSGLRPMTPDGLPVIGPEPRLDGLWYATGHGRNGILLAGITGELIAQAIEGDPLPAGLALVRPDRFWDW
jgi:glycine oxidase